MTSLRADKHSTELSVTKKEMCFFCFDVLYNSLNNKDPPPEPKFTNDCYPIFVTWKAGSDKKLRGCVGTFSPMELHSGLREYAMISAFRDQRFDPISKEELQQLTCCVSLLKNFEDGKDYRDWQVGVHGVRIEFEVEPGHRRSATFLPEVASERGWDYEETIDALLRKGGYRGSISSDVRKSVKLVRYQSEKIAASWHEYREHIETMHSG